MDRKLNISYLYDSDKGSYGDLICELTTYMDKYIKSNIKQVFFKTYIFNSIEKIGIDLYRLLLRVPGRTIGNLILKRVSFNIFILYDIKLDEEYCFGDNGYYDKILLHNICKFVGMYIDFQNVKLRNLEDFRDMNNDRDLNDMTVEKEYVTWQDVEKFIQFLADNTHNFKDFNGVYGPARGGLVYAVIISNRYNIPFLGAPQKGCLVVDDICDTGDTALAWKDKGYTIATHYYKPGSKVYPDYHYKIKEDKWISFPWED